LLQAQRRRGSAFHAYATEIAQTLSRDLLDQ